MAIFDFWLLFNLVESYKLSKSLMGVVHKVDMKK